MEENDFTGVTILKPKESSFGGFIAAGSWQSKLPLADGTDGPQPRFFSEEQIGGTRICMRPLVSLPYLPVFRGEFHMRRLPSLFAVLALAMSTTCPVVAQQPAHPKVGTLTCDISAGIGFIIGSQKQVTCMFTPAQGGPAEVYVGSISKFGLDIGATAGGEMVWSVYAPTSRQIAALAGNYTGASAEATVGLGLGANVLVGGSDRTVTLQPLSVQGQAGLNLAVGVAGLELRPAG